jgi:hypothetical protein
MKKASVKRNSEQENGRILHLLGSNELKPPDVDFAHLKTFLHAYKGTCLNSIKEQTSGASGPGPQAAASPRILNSHLG